MTGLKRTINLDTEKKGKRTDKLCVYTGLFLWGSVCVFQLWTVDYQKQHGLVSVSPFCA